MEVSLLVWPTAELVVGDVAKRLRDTDSGGP
jgi:hypothetical protein